MRTINWSRHKYAALLSAVGFPLLYLLLYLAQGGRGTFGANASVLSANRPASVRGFCNLVYACFGRHSSVSRQRGWLLLGLRACPTVGDLIYFYYVGMRRIAAPFPASDDVAWLFVFPLLIGGVIAFSAVCPARGVCACCWTARLPAAAWRLWAGTFSWSVSGSSPATSLPGKTRQRRYSPRRPCRYFQRHRPVQQSGHQPLSAPFFAAACGRHSPWAFADLVYAYSPPAQTFTTMVRGQTWAGRLGLIRLASPR